ncbi:MAG TPA: ribosome maturation factor RimM [Vicinamibacterales bacterium]|nr:ribosome maturation factor RimM [Vicinamibacterales bacterium]
MGDDLVLVGRVARAHGNKGQVIVNLETDFPDERFRTGERLFVGAGESPASFRIVHVRFHQGRPIVALEGVETMDQAQALAGQELRIVAADRPALPAGTYYRDELVGSEVTDLDGRQVGHVTAVEGPMELSRLVVTGPRGEVLIPLAAEICVRVDPAARLIVVNPPEGLLELNLSSNRESTPQLPRRPLDP